MPSKKQEPEPQPRISILLAVGVIVATGAAFYLLGKKDEPESTQDESVVVEQEVLEVTPLVPSNAITSASWRTEAAADPEPADDGTFSVLETHDFGDAAERRDRTRKSLEKAVAEIHGLGVYVAPPEDDDAPRRGK